MKCYAIRLAVVRIKFCIKLTYAWDKIYAYFIKVRICQQKHTINDTHLFKCHVFPPTTLNVISRHISKKKIVFRFFWSLKSILSTYKPNARAYSICSYLMCFLDYTTMADFICILNGSIIRRQVNSAYTI